MVLYLLILSISSTNPTAHHLTYIPLSESMDSYHYFFYPYRDSYFLFFLLNQLILFFPYSYFSFSIFSRIFQLISYFLSVSSSQRSILFLFLSFFSVLFCSFSDQKQKKPPETPFPSPFPFLSFVSTH